PRTETGPRASGRRARAAHGPRDQGRLLPRQGRGVQPAPDGLRRRRAGDGRTGGPDHGRGRRGRPVPRQLSVPHPTMKRGDVVVAVFPYVGGGASKNRPAVVVQCDRLNRAIQNTIVAMITGNTRLAGRTPTQFLIDPATPEGQTSGLVYVSAVKCENLMT